MYIRCFCRIVQILCSDNKDVLEEFIQRVERTLSESTIKKRMEKIDRDITATENKKKTLLDMRLENQIDNLTYQAKLKELDTKLEELLDERAGLEQQQQEEKQLHARTMEFKKLLEKNQVLEVFDRAVFESIVEKVIVGEINENGEKDPYKLTFVYKTGTSSKIDAKMQKRLKLGKTMKDNVKKLCSYVRDEVEELSSSAIE